MKTKVAFVGLLFVASLMQAQPAPAPAPAPKPADPATPTTPAAKPEVTAKTAPDKTPAAKDKKVTKEEPPPKIPGVEIARPNGTFLGLEVAGGNFKLTFYDKKKKPMAVDVTRGMARWPNKKSATTGDNRTVLNGSGTFLVGAKPVVPPFAFNVYLTLLQGEGDEAKAVENYVVPFHG
ncbi:MAG TPA: hypothetical protein VKC51_06350 [Lacunisphaera sp.]|nr:hypothetical protein [Lacunisphaera sp.]